MQQSTTNNPLLGWMRQQGLTPYTQNSILTELTGLSHRYLGDIATGKRRCEVKSLVKIQQATAHQVTAAMMIEHWYGLPARPVSTTVQVQP